MKKKESKNITKSKKKQSKEKGRLRSSWRYKQLKRREQNKPNKSKGEEFERTMRSRWKNIRTNY
jgi:hypothetical protein